MSAENAELDWSLGADRRRARRARRGLDQQLLAIFEEVAQKRNGIAVAEARDGICTHLPRAAAAAGLQHRARNEEIVQCDNCQRILYFAADDGGRRGRPARASPHSDRDSVQRWNPRSSPTSTAAPAAIRAGRLRRPHRAPDGTLVEEFGDSIGVATNNVAEYRALIAALEWAVAHARRQSSRPIRFAAARPADARRVQGEASAACSRCIGRPERSLAHEARHVRARRPRAQRARRSARQRRDGSKSSSSSRCPDRAASRPAREPSRRYEQNASGWLAVHSSATKIRSGGSTRAARADRASRAQTSKNQ